jgi:chromosome segregation ATPase
LYTLIFIAITACSPEDDTSSKKAVPTAVSAENVTTTTPTALESENASQEAAPGTISEDKPAPPEQDEVSTLQDSLKSTGEAVEAARQENLELSKRIEQLEQRFQEYQQQMIQKDEQLTDLQQQLKGNDSAKE